MSKIGSRPILMAKLNLKLSQVWPPALPCGKLDSHIVRLINPRPPTSQEKELDAMSRQILEITLRLPDGRELTGRGRNVPATMERIYNQALTPTPRRHVRFMEPLESGQRRYYGTYHVQFGYRSGHDTTLDGVVVAEVGDR